MPRPLPIPVREMIYKLWKKEWTVERIADHFDLLPRTVRRLINRFAELGEGGIHPSYRKGPQQLSPEHAQERETARRLRRDHPGWGAELIRVFLSRESDEAAAARTVRRWLASTGQGAAPPGRKPNVVAPRAQRPHEVWQMDAAEDMPLASGQHVSWLRIVDECTGAFLATRVFPLGPMESRFHPSNQGVSARLVPGVGAA